MEEWRVMVVAVAGNRWCWRRRWRRLGMMWGWWWFGVRSSERGGEERERGCLEREQFRERADGEREEDKDF
ncbi:hypothetical protein HanIR_Chr16g0838241 [Helianthus annuus]|nr:hypothetical protein HanIR_Chr16g0838241 [Helianthus annuus]